MSAPRKERNGEADHRSGIGTIAAIAPVHHDGWAHFTESQEDLAKAFQALGLSNRLRRVTGGEVIRFG